MTMLTTLGLAMAAIGVTAAGAEPVVLSVSGLGAPSPVEREALRSQFPAVAVSAAQAPLPVTDPPAAPRVPATTTGYRAVFAAIRAGDWSSAAARLDTMFDGPLHAVARAELYLAKGSPRVEAGPLLELIETAPELPQAASLSALARTRGAVILPTLPYEQRLVGLSPAPRRERARPVEGDTVSEELRALAEPLIKNDQPTGLESLLVEREAALSPEALTEWRQRVAWTYYVVGNYDSARRLAEMAGAGAGEWAVQGDWVLGLTAWRQGDCAAAARAFGRVADRARDSELVAGGHFWAARADIVCKRPERVQARMRSAARLSETFYGLLAGATLNIKPKALPVAPPSPALASRPNVKAAKMLAELGETGLADRLIRHQARLGGAGDHAGLLALSAQLNLASTQFWLAHNGPAGTYVKVGDRYPAPRWSPQHGWRVDKALVYAHTLQESSFRTGVVSPAGATGLMQVRPGTAGDIARSRGEYFSTDQLRQPSYNIEYGQTYLEQLSGRGATGGLLPKVIAAYNAGPVPVERWNLSVRDGGDPLLYIESLPYWETRGYVPTILRNYWIYQAEAGQPSPSLVELAQGKWPRFPTTSRRVAQNEGQVVIGQE